jgi:hypothetical protein
MPCLLVKIGQLVSIDRSLLMWSGLNRVNNRAEGTKALACHGKIAVLSRAAMIRNETYKKKKVNALVVSHHQPAVLNVITVTCHRLKRLIS